LNFLLFHNINKKKQYGLGLSLICLVSGICYSLSGFFSPEVVAFALLLTLSVIAMFFDILPVLVCALFSVLIWDFFFLSPHFAFYVNDTQDIVTLCMYFVIVLLNAALTYKIRQIEKRAREKEEKARTLELYNTLLDSLSHELRTPIAVIIGATDNLLAASPALTDHDKKNLLSAISLASLRLNHQVENLLNMSRLQSGFIQLKKDGCDVRELVFDVVQRLDEELRDHRVVIDIPKNFPLFMLDYGLLQQVIYNLVHNAGKYTAQGTTIRISADYTGSTVVLVVEDTGPGFPNDETEKIFEKFYRLKSTKPGGTGLGLSIVKGFVGAHHGTVYLQNSISGGAKFEIIIPAQKMLIKDTDK
jgi:two-component system, OmpR family, sensor histidine kinase KdpD